MPLVLTPFVRNPGVFATKNARYREYERERHHWLTSIEELKNTHYIYIYIYMYVCIHVCIT